MSEDFAHILRLFDYIILISDQLLFSFPLSNTTGTLISINGKN